MGNLGPNLPKFKVFGQSFKFESLDFSDFAYLNWQTGFLNDSGGPVAGKNFWAQFRPKRYPKFGQKNFFQQMTWTI